MDRPGLPWTAPQVGEVGVVRSPTGGTHEVAAEAELSLEKGWDL